MSDVSLESNEVMVLMLMEEKVESIVYLNYEVKSMMLERVGKQQNDDR